MLGDDDSRCSSNLVRLQSVGYVVAEPGRIAGTIRFRITKEGEKELMALEGDDLNRGTTTLVRQPLKVPTITEDKRVKLLAHPKREKVVALYTREDHPLSMKRISFETGVNEDDVRAMLVLSGVRIRGNGSISNGKRR
jgi:hypothetical protein